MPAFETAWACGRAKGGGEHVSFNRCICAVRVILLGRAASSAYIAGYMTSSSARISFESMSPEPSRSNMSKALRSRGASVESSISSSGAVTSWTAIFAFSWAAIAAKYLTRMAPAAIGNAMPRHTRVRPSSKASSVAQRSRPSRQIGYTTYGMTMRKTWSMRNANESCPARM
eukprot:6133635-Prymnesium_polylepis.2